MEIHQNSEKPNQNDAHILIASFPLQGHSAPLVKLSHRLTKLGNKVTFLTMDLIRARTPTGTTVSESWNEGIRTITISTWLETDSKLFGVVRTVMPGYLEDLLKTSQQSFNDRISGVILPTPLSGMLEIPKKMGIKTAICWCSGLGILAVGLKIPQLIESKFIDSDGAPLGNEGIKLMPDMPEMAPTDLQWYFPGNKDKQKSIFEVSKRMTDQVTSADWIICCHFHELCPAATNLAPNILPIGPFLSDGDSSASLYSVDSTCLAWLDKQPKNSVIYVAFGSSARFNQQQLEELAMGLELMGRPFLWVAWSGLTNGSFPTYSKEFEERVGDRGKIVEWAPQEAVLSHPSTACYITHCGFGSFLESLSRGVPVLCWSYFADQMYTEKLICDAWKVGMRFERDENGIVSRNEIKKKVEELLCDGIIRENALKWKRLARESINKGGSSFTNLEYVLHQMKRS